MSDAGTMYANAKALHELLQEARAENDKLVMKLNAEHLVRQNLAAENAKLRELVAAMPYCMETRCLECPMCSPFDTSIGGVPECRASWKLRELGVEV